MVSFPAGAQRREGNPPRWHAMDPLPGLAAAGDDSAYVDYRMNRLRSVFFARLSTSPRT